MNKTIKMFNGDIREFETNEQYQKLQEENYSMIHEYYENEKIKMKETIEKIKSYVDKANKEHKYSNYEIGLVYTKLEEDIKDKNSFLIYTNSYTVQHKYISLDDIN